MYLFISPLYMFRASQCSSSEDRIVLIHHLVWLVCVSDCLVCRSARTKWHGNFSAAVTKVRTNLVACVVWNLERRNLNARVFADFREIVHECKIQGQKQSEHDIRSTPYSHFVTCWCTWWIPCQRCPEHPACSISLNEVRPTVSSARQNVHLSAVFPSLLI
jgi:hypothetical protein